MQTDVRKAREFYFDFFTKNSTASIDMAAKAASALGMPILKEVASSERRKVLQEMDNKKTPATPAPGKWFNEELKQKPRVRLEEIQPVPKSQPIVEIKPTLSKALPVSVPQEAPEPAAPPVDVVLRDSTGELVTDEKKRFILEYLAKDPAAHPQIIMAKVREKYGKGTGFEFMYQECRAARGKNGLPGIPNRYDPEGRASPSSPMSLGVFRDSGRESVELLVKEIAILIRESGLQFEDFVVSAGDGKKLEYTCSFKAAYAGVIE